MTPIDSAITGLRDAMLDTDGAPVDESALDFPDVEAIDAYLDRSGIAVPFDDGSYEVAAAYADSVVSVTGYPDGRRLYHFAVPDPCERA